MTSPAFIIWGPLFFFFFFFLFRAALVAYGSSQARGKIRAAAANLHHSPRQRWILNPLTKARDRTCVLVDASQIHFHWATTGTPEVGSLKNYIFFLLRYNSWNIKFNFYFISSSSSYLVFLPFLGPLPKAYGGSQARGIIRAVATSLHHSHRGSKPHLQPTPRSRQHRTLNPLSEARDGTCYLTNTSRIRFHWSMTRTPRELF